MTDIDKLEALAQVASGIGGMLMAEREKIGVPQEAQE